MSKKQPWGIYAPYINDFIDLKRSLGFKYTSEEAIFLSFDRFSIEQGETKVGLTKELADKWCERRNNESDSYRYHRCVCISQLSSHLCKLGIRSYIPLMPRIQSTFIPYIFSKEEMTAIFNAADSLVLSRKFMNSIIFVVPTLLRLLYGTGLRISEALSLRNEDVNLREDYLVITDSKNGKQRMVPISTTLSGVCKDYVQYRDKLPVHQSGESRFFINLNGTDCKLRTFYRFFRLVLNTAGIPYIGGCHGPRIQDMRHTFACHSPAKMAESGIDLYASLPVLSTYLGHQSISATNSYVRLTQTMYPGLLKDIDMVCMNVFPNIEGHEHN